MSFTESQHAALAMLAERAQRQLDPGVADQIVAAMSSLPPHPEVTAALADLRRAGTPMVALTNSVGAVAEAQLSNAGLRACFDDVVSADEVGRLKPSREPYELVAARRGVAPACVRLVAAHAWDISGALAAGCRAAFVARPGMVLSPLGAQPDIVGADMRSVADQLLARR